MNSLSVTGALREAGVTFEMRGDRLRVAPAAKMTPELVALVREHKEDLAHIACARDATGPPIEAAGEVFDMARAILNPEGIDYDPPPTPPLPRGRDPLAKRSGSKVEFYREVRRKNQERRARGDWPPHIRPVDGGVS